MAWYYGVNNSQLYGSNFSTVLADAPPPLDDTFDEDDNEIVFRNDVNKSKKQIKEKENVSADVKKRHTNDDFNERSKVGSNVANGGNAFHFEKVDQGSGDLEKEDDFGDFASFADFGSAFGRDEISGEESHGWFGDEESSGNSFDAENTTGSQDEQPDSAGDEHDDFAAFQQNESNTKSRGNFPIGAKQDNGWVENNKIISNDEKNDDNFGDFTSQSVNATQSSDVWNASADGSKGTQQLHSCELDSGELSNVASSKTSNANAGSEENAAQCNGNSIHNISGDRRGENKGIGSLRKSLDDVSKADGRYVSELALEQDNNFKAEDGSSEVSLPDEFERLPVKDQDSRPLSKLSAEATDDQSSETFSIHAKEAQISNKQENVIEKDRSDCNARDSSKDPQGLPENTFEKFANFHDKRVIEGSVDCSKLEGYVDDKINNPARMTSTCIDKATCGPFQRVDFLVEAKHNGDDDDDFGDFGAFQENSVLEKDQSRHDSVPKGFQQSTLGKENKNAKDDDSFQGFLPKNRELDDEREGDDFANFTTFNSDGKPSFSNVQSDDNDFGDFGTFNSKDIDSQQDRNKCAKDFHTGDNDNGFGDFSSFESNARDPETTESKNDFEDFRESNTKDSPGKFELNAMVSLSKEITDDFGDFASIEKKNDCKDSLKSEDGADDFGEFGSFESKEESSNKGEASIGDISVFSTNAKESQGNHDDDDFGSLKSEDVSIDSPRPNNTDDFGDFGSFESKSQVVGTEDGNDDNFGDFGSLESNTRPSQEEFPSDNFGSFKGQDSCVIKNGDDGDADFGTFESEEKSVDSSVKDSNISKTQNKKEDFFEDFRTSKSPEFGGSKSSSKFGNLNVSSHQTGGLNERKKQQNDGSKMASFQERKPYVKVQRTQTALHFQPGSGVLIKQAEGPISVCFRSEQRVRQGSFQSDALLSKLDKGFHSNMGLWQHLEKSEKEGRLLFNWSNSFSDHKKFLSLKICPERPPPLQGGSMLLPEPTSKFPPFSLGAGFLEPIKAGIQEKQVPNNGVLQDLSRADVMLPDLGFILGNSLPNTASKSDVKDNVSDTASESSRSSLDLEFFAPSTIQLSDAKSDSKALHEDLLGLDILSSSSEMKKGEIPKAPKVSSTNMKKVWQHGGVTIPLSQGKRAELSATAKSVLEQLEDLTFMSSSVLMFPLKPE